MPSDVVNESDAVRTFTSDAGPPVIETAGGVLSVTTTLNVVALTAGLPAASVALHVTVVVPDGKLEPEAGAHVTTAGSLVVGFV